MLGVADFVERLPAGASASQCLILLPAPTMLPQRLLCELKGAGVRFSLLAEPPRVMVELARRHGGAVIVCEPAQIRESDCLIEAVTTYHPEVPCWRYSALESRLSPWVPMDRPQRPPRYDGDWPSTYGDMFEGHGGSASELIAEIPEDPHEPHGPARQPRADRPGPGEEP